MKIAEDVEKLYIEVDSVGKGLSNISHEKVSLHKIILQNEMILCVLNLFSYKLNFDDFRSVLHIRQWRMKSRNLYQHCKMLIEYITGIVIMRIIEGESKQINTVAMNFILHRNITSAVTSLLYLLENYGRPDMMWPYR